MLTFFRKISNDTSGNALAIFAAALIPLTIMIGSGLDVSITYMARADDMMNAGGFRVSPIEVENALSDLPGITEIGVTDCEVKADTRLIIAFYTGPKKLDDQALMTAAQERLARYKQPRAFVHLPELPTGGNGKLLRRALPAYFKASTP